MTDIETRSFRVPFELRTDGENQTIVGYASTFDQPYPVDMVTEIIDRSAFTRTLSEKPDVYALIGHDPSRILGRTKNGTLSLSIDERGLKCIITPVMTRDAEDTLKLIASGCIDAMSFGFKVVKQAFGYADGKTTRRITDLELHEVSCVAFPANENATLSLRAKQMAKEFRASQGNDISEEEGRSSSARLETREAFNPIYYKYGVFEIKEEGRERTNDDGEPLSVGWWFWFRRGRTTDSDREFGGAFKSRSEALIALKAKEEDERNKWEATEGRSSSTRLEKRGKTVQVDMPDAYAEFIGFAVTTNGNKVARFRRYGGQIIRIQTNGNLPKAHSMTNESFDAGVIEKEVLASSYARKFALKERSSSTRLETRGAQLIMAFLPTNQTFRAFYGDPKGDPSEWSAENNLLRSWGAPINTKKELKYFADQENYTLKQISKGIYTLTSGGSRSSSTMKLLELRNSIASPIDTETRGLADFALMASAGLGLFLVSKIVSGVLFFWYDCAYNTYGGGKKKVRVSAKTDKDAMAEVKKLNPDAQDIEVQKVKK